MEKSGNFAEKWRATLGALRSDDVLSEDNTEPKITMQKVKEVISVIGRVIYRLRKVFMAAPVIYYALKLADYCSENLPEMVGLNIQSNGTYAEMISRASAVNGCLTITGACLVLMLFSRKATYPWIISIFSLVVPILLLITNVYPI